MRQLKMSRVFTLIEPGPVVLVTTCDENKNNIMTISWTMVLDFTPAFAITTGAWYYSFAALQRTRECVIAIPTVDLLDQVVGIGTCFPQLGGYASTKYALNALSLTARQELASDNIVVSVFHPKMTATEFGQNARGETYHSGAGRPGMIVDTRKAVAEKMIQLIESGEAEAQM